MAEENADVGLSAAEADELLTAYTGYKPGEDSAFGLTSEESDALLKSFEQQQYEPTVLEPEERQRTIVSEVYEDDPRRLSPGSQPLPEIVDVQKVKDEMFEYLIESQVSVSDAEALIRDALRAEEGQKKLEGVPDYEEPETVSDVVSATFFGRRLLPTTSAAEGKDFKESRLEQQRERARRVQALIDKGAYFTAVKDELWDAQDPITEEQARQSGMNQKYRGFLGSLMEAKGLFGRAPGDEEDSFFIPYILKAPFTDAPEITERIGEFIGVGNAFAPLFVEDKDMEAYQKTVKMVNPTENFERLVDRYESAQEFGLSRPEIKTEFGEDFYRMLAVQSYNDLPLGSRISKPSVESFKAEVKQNPKFFATMIPPRLKEAIDLANSDGSDAEIQKRLDKTPFVYLPTNVWAGTTPSPDRLIDYIFDDIETVIAAKGDAGKSTRRLLKNIQQTMLVEEKVGDEILIVESTFGKLLRLTGVFTEPFMEIRLPGDIPITPASRDFYYELGIRDKDTGYFANVIANIAEGNIGPATHAMNEAIARDYTRDDPEYSSYAIVGNLFELLMPWERMAAAPVLVPTKSVYRGSRLARSFDLKGGWSNPEKWKLFYAGATPNLYGYVENVASNVDFSVKLIQRLTDGDITADSLQKLLDADDARVAARLEGQDVPTDEMGRELGRLGYVARRVAEQVLEKIQDGVGLDDAINQVKNNYKPDRYEVIQHAVATLYERIAHTEEGKRLFKQTGDDQGGILPFTIEQQLARVVESAGFNYRDVKTKAQEAADENSETYMRNLRAAYFLGDSETIELRSSAQYKKAVAKLNKLVSEGRMTADQKIVLLSILENRSIHATVSDIYPSIKKPEDFFAKFKIKDEVVKGEGFDVEKGGLKFTVDGKVMSISEDGLNKIMEIYREGNLMKLLDNNGEPMIDLMGNQWTKTFFEHFDIEENFDPKRKITNKLSKDGEKQVELLLRSLIEGKGNLGAKANEAAQLFENLQAAYARMRGDSANFIPTDIRGRLDGLLSPDRWFRNDLIDINMRARRRTDQRVFIGEDPIEELGKESRRKVGQKRFFDIDTEKDYVRQGLGIVEPISEMEATTLMARGLGYVMAETFKLQESRALIGGLRTVPIGFASAVSPSKAKSVRARVNARLARTLGIEKHSAIKKRIFLDADKIKEMAEPDKKRLVLNLSQQSRFRMLIARLIDEPYAQKRLPRSISKFDADLSVVSFKDYNILVKVMQDIEAGGVARTSLYSDKIPKSFGYALFNAMKEATAPVIRKSGLNKVTNKLDTWFNVQRPMDDTVKPELREVARAGLKDLQNTPSEVIEAARLARSDNPDAAIEYMFDKLKDLVVRRFSDQQIDLIMGTEKQKGIRSLISDLTQAELNRINIETAKAVDSGDIPPMSQNTRRIIEANDNIISADDAEAGIADQQYSFKIPPGMSRIQFITRRKTIQQIYDAAKGLTGFRSFDDVLLEAFARLDMYSSRNGMTPKMVAQLSDADRVALMDALFIIQKKLETNARSIIQRADIVLKALGGDTFKLPDKINKIQKAAYLKSFYKGEGKDGWSALYDLLVVYGGRLDAARQSISGISPAQAFLEMITRMMVEQKLENLFDDLVRHGMPTAYQNYTTPNTKIGPTGAKYSIDTRHAFYDRVKGHIRQIYEESGDIITYRTRTTEDGETITEVVKGPRQISADPTDATAAEQGPSGYRFAAFEPRPTIDFNDLEALRAAEEILVKFGRRNRYSGESQFQIYQFPSGEQVYMPNAMADEIQNAVERSGRVGEMFMGEAATTLRMSKVSAPYLSREVPQDVAGSEIAQDKVASALRNLIRLFPVSTSLVKQGITTGFVIPMVPYYVANAVGGAFQLITAVGPIEGARILTKNPKFVKSVMTRMYGRNRFRPGANEILVTKSGEIYTTETFTDLALMYGLDSSFIQAETSKSMAEDIERYLRDDQSKYSYKKVGDYASSWHQHFRDVATAIDNFYRVSIFASEVFDGISPTKAAATARSAAFDYGALTDYEKTVMRNVIMFYSYMRKNMDLFYDTLMTAPDRVVNQLRLTNGLHQVNMDTDPQLGMREYQQERIKIAFTAATRNKMSKEVKMYALPPTPIMDGFNPIIDIIDSLKGSDEAQRMLGTKLVPWLQAPMVGMFDMDLFYGMQIDKFNRVPPFLVELDQAWGGYLHQILDLQPDSSTNMAYRHVEGDDDRPIMIARNGMNWYLMRNLVQIPPFGRYLTLFEALDRSNLGAVEGFVDMSKEAGRYLEENDYMDVAIDKFQPGDTQSPRVGYTTFDEFLRFFGVTVFISDTEAEKASKVYKKLARGDWKRMLPRYSERDLPKQAEEKATYQFED